MSVKSIAKVWTFKSSSSDRTYQTLRYTDGSTSCDCPGWTRRVSTDGSRSCTHTRDVDMGRADAKAIACHEYNAAKAMLHTGEMVSVKKTSQPTTPTLQYGHRKLCI